MERVGGVQYPCIKDLSRLGRPLSRTVLVDDTPLAFCRQPDNGIPVFNFRQPHCHLHRMVVTIRCRSIALECT